MLFHVSYTVSEPADGQWGLFKDGRWTGLIGDIERKVQHIGPII